MSAPISTSLPISTSPSSEGSEAAAGFEGAAALLTSWREGLTPDPWLTVSEWADRHRWLSSRASAEPGRYRTDRTPYMRAIMDALSPASAAQRIVFMKAAQVAPVKGAEGFNRASPVSGPTFVDATAGGKRLRRGARLWTVAVSTFKAETYRFLRLPRPTPEELTEGAALAPGTVHLSGWADTEWIRQLTAEQLVTVRNRRGFAKLEWQKLRERNEALDCRVYARAAAWIAGADRWPEATWADLEAQLGVPASAGRIARPAAATEGKRRSDWLGRRERWF